MSPPARAAGSSDPEAVHPLLAVTAEEKAKLAGSFGGAAEHYARYRPGPSAEAVDWMLAEPGAAPGRRSIGRIVDLGAGTGALTRLLVDQADEVVAVEPDDQMRAVLTEQVPGARAVHGRGESIPLPDHSADAVLASSSWHWMDPVDALREVARVLVPGGVLGVVWSGPDPEGVFLTQAQAVLAARSEPSGEQPEQPEGSQSLGGFLGTVVRRPEFALEIPDGGPFHPVEHETFAWNVAMGEDELIGLLGTMSWIITMDDEPRERMLDEARTVLRGYLESQGAATVDVAFKALAWRSRVADVT